MKKILLTILLIALSANKICAETYTIPVSYNVAPTYTLRLPSRIDVSQQETQLVFYIKADIYMDQTLNVEFDQNTVIYSDHSSSNIEVCPYKYTFTSNDLSVSFNPFFINLSHNNLDVGTYSGYLNFEIYLQGGNDE